MQNVEKLNIDLFNKNTHLTTPTMVVASTVRSCKVTNYFISIHMKNIYEDKTAISDNAL